MNIKLFPVICEEPVGLVSAMVLSAKTPVHVWRDLFLFEVYYTEDTATYFVIPSSDYEM